MLLCITVSGGGGGGGGGTPWKLVGPSSNPTTFHGLPYQVFFSPTTTSGSESNETERWRGANVGPLQSAASFRLDFSDLLYMEAWGNPGRCKEYCSRRYCERGRLQTVAYIKSEQQTQKFNSQKILSRCLDPTKGPGAGVGGEMKEQKAKLHTLGSVRDEAKFNWPRTAQNPMDYIPYLPHASASTSPTPSSRVTAPTEYHSS